MSNTITKAEKYLPIIDGLYKKGSLTAILDAPTQVSFDGTNTVKVMKATVSGLGDYSRATGYPAASDVSLTWESLVLAEERAKVIKVDRCDNEETLGQAFGVITSEFMRLNVAPELDAYRFAKFASKAGISTADAADLSTGSAVLSAIDEATKVLDGNEAGDNRVLFVSSALKPLLMGAVTREWGSEGAVSRVLDGYNGMPIIYVPQSRFYTAITLNDGTSSWGFAKGATAKNINFMMLDKDAVLQAVKLAMPKIFTPDENQSDDCWKFMFRCYHDAFVMDNKVGGVYLHKSTT